MRENCLDESVTKKRNISPSSRVLRKRKTNIPSEDINNNTEEESDIILPMRGITSASDLFAAFNIDVHSTLRKSLSSSLSRTSLQNWEADSKESKQMKLSVVNVYKHIFSQIAALLCGPAGSLSIAYALTNFRDVAEHALTLPLIRTIVRSKKSQQEPRVARAYLCGSTGRSKVAQLVNVYKEFSLSNNTYVKGLSDFNKLTNGQRLSPPRRSCQRFDPALVNQAIAFILGSDNVCHTSWGTKTIVVDGIPRAFPLLMRKISRTNMYANYQKSTTV